MRSDVNPVIGSETSRSRIGNIAFVRAVSLTAEAFDGLDRFTGE